MIPSYILSQTRRDFLAFYHNLITSTTFRRNNFPVYVPLLRWKVFSLKTSRTLEGNVSFLKEYFKDLSRNVVNLQLPSKVLSFLGRFFSFMYDDTQFLAMKSIYLWCVIMQFTRTPTETWPQGGLKKPAQRELSSGFECTYAEPQSTSLKMEETWLIQKVSARTKSITEIGQQKRLDILSSKSSFQLVQQEDLEMPLEYVA